MKDGRNSRPCRHRRQRPVVWLSHARFARSSTFAIAVVDRRLRDVWPPCGSLNAAAPLFCRLRVLRRVRGTGRNDLASRFHRHSGFPTGSTGSKGLSWFGLKTPAIAGFSMS